jgi:hypothetical protein
MSQMEGIQAATSAFRLKYDCKAGDCAKAQQFGLGTSGNGDGLDGARNSGSVSAFPNCLSNGGVCVTDVAVSAALCWYITGESSSSSLT